MLKRLILAGFLVAASSFSFAEDSRCTNVSFFGKVGSATCPSYKSDNQKCASASWAQTYGAKACVTIKNEKCPTPWARTTSANAAVCKALSSTAPTTTTTSEPTRTATTDASQCVDLMYFKNYGVARCPSYNTDAQNCADARFASTYPAKCATTKTKCGDSSFATYNPNNSAVCSALGVGGGSTSPTSDSTSPFGGTTTDSRCDDPKFATMYPSKCQ